MYVIYIYQIFGIFTYIKFFQQVTIHYKTFDSKILSFFSFCIYKNEMNMKQMGNKDGGTLLHAHVI